MKKQDIKSLSKEELEEKLNELKGELIKLNAQVATGTTPKSPGLVKQTRKNIARLLTQQRQNKN